MKTKLETNNGTKSTKPATASAPPKTRRIVQLEAGLARIDMFGRLEFLQSTERCHSKTLKEEERRFWEKVWPTFKTDQPCSKREFIKQWERLLDLENQLRLVRRLRQRLVAHHGYLRGYLPRASKATEGLPK
jgi:hypothetical protein